MTSKQLIYMISQVLCILGFLAWILVLIIKIRRQEYKYKYIFSQLIFHKNKEPLIWLGNNLIYVYYFLQVIALLFINFGLIAQIRDNTLYQKSWTFFVGAFLLAVSTGLTLNYYNDQSHNKSVT